MATKTIPVVSAGIDRGFGGSKYYSDLIQGGYVESMVAPISEERAKEIIANKKEDDEVIVFKEEDLYFLVGKAVAQLEPSYAERDLSRGRDSINETVLFKVCMGLSTGDFEDSKLVIATGLPTDDLPKLKGFYKNKLLNEGKPYQFSIFKCGKEYKKNINVIKVTIENQPKGTVIAVLNKKLLEGAIMSEINARRFGICDMGYNTTDLSMYVGKDMVSGDKINFSTFATEQIVATAKKIIDATFETNKSEQEILDALKTHTIKKRGKDVDCTKEIKEAFETNAQLLLKEIRTKWQKYLDTLDEFIITGGTLENEIFAEILSNLFEQECGWGTVVPDNPQFANAFGFYLIAVSITPKV